MYSKNFRKHCFTNVCALFSVVLLIRHVSAPYSNTDLTFVLNRQIFVVLPITLDFHAFLNNFYVECCFADSCLYVSLEPPIPPRVSTMLLRFLNDSTSSLSSIIGLSQVVSNSWDLSFPFVDLLKSEPGMLSCLAFTDCCQTLLQGHLQSPSHQVVSKSYTAITNSRIVPQPK